jgi:hypothetical protein
LNLDENEEATGTIERSKEAELKEENDKFEELNEGKIVGSMINTYKVGNIRSESKKRVENFESRPRNN